MSGSNSWLNSDALFFDRVADDLMYTHARIWEAAEPSQDPTSCRHLSPSPNTTIQTGGSDCCRPN
jgi:hypothetical protein